MFFKWLLQNRFWFTDHQPYAFPIAGSPGIFGDKFSSPVGSRILWKIRVYCCLLLVPSIGALMFCLKHRCHWLSFPFIDCFVYLAGVRFSWSLTFSAIDFSPQWEADFYGSPTTNFLLPEFSIEVLMFYLKHRCYWLSFFLNNSFLISSDVPLFCHYDCGLTL